MRVKEAEDGEPALPGCAYIAPGARHMLLQRTGLCYQIAIKDGPPVMREVEFFNWLEGGVYTACAPGDQEKSIEGKRGWLLSRPT
jgi:hypothetical protein